MGYCGLLFRQQLNQFAMKIPSNNGKLRLAVLQRVCAGYRVSLFQMLADNKNIEMRLFIGDDLPVSKVRNATDLKSIPHSRLKTWHSSFGARMLTWHRGLIKELDKFSPDVILCEGESHFLGYLQAIVYKYFFNHNVALMHWCFISLPGWRSVGGKGMRSHIKAFFRKFFDAFVVYSSFSKDSLVSLGQSGEKIFVATNV